MNFHTKLNRISYNGDKKEKIGERVRERERERERQRECVCERERKE